MVKWNYLTYYRVCHEPFPAHRVKSEIPNDLSEVKSEAKSSVAAVEVVAVDSVEQVITVHLPQVLHNL
jgi:hypothetical protein